MVSRIIMRSDDSVFHVFIENVRSDFGWNPSMSAINLSLLSGSPGNRNAANVSFRLSASYIALWVSVSLKSVYVVLLAVFILCLLSDGSDQFEW